MPLQSPSLEKASGSNEDTAASDVARSETSVPESVPHFKSFDHIADERIRRAMDYEQYLQFSLERFPEFAERIQREIAFAQSEQHRDHVSDRDRVFLAIEVEELNKTEIAGDTGLPGSTVYKHLRELIDVGLVYQKKLPGRGNKFMLVYGHSNAKP